MTLQPAEVLQIIADRMETRAKALDGVRMKEYEIAALELNQFAKMIRNARAYLLEGPIKPHRPPGTTAPTSR